MCCHCSSPPVSPARHPSFLLPTVPWQVTLNISIHSCPEEFTLTFSFYYRSNLMSAFCTPKLSGWVICILCPFFLFLNSKTYLSWFPGSLMSVFLYSHLWGFSFFPSLRAMPRVWIIPFSDHQALWLPLSPCLLKYCLTYFTYFRKSFWLISPHPPAPVHEHWECHLA